MKLALNFAFGTLLALALASNVAHGFYFVEPAEDGSASEAEAKVPDNLASSESSSGIEIENLDAASSSTTAEASAAASSSSSSSADQEIATTTEIITTATSTDTPTTATPTTTTTTSAESASEAEEVPVTNAGNLDAQAAIVPDGAPFGVRSSGSSSTTATPTTAATPPASTAAPPASGAASSIPVSGANNVNRIWHYNSQGLNTDSVWFSPRVRSAAAAGDLEAQAVESSAVRAPAPPAVSSVVSASPSESSPTFLPRKPILADENDEPEQDSDRFDSSANTLTKRFGTNAAPAAAAAAAAPGAAFGEYRNREKDLYYPDIARIRADGAVISSSSSSSSSSSAAAASSGASTATSASALSPTWSSSPGNYYSTKGGITAGGGGESERNVWQQIERLQSPVKSIRKVVKQSGKQIEQQTYGSGANGITTTTHTTHTTNHFAREPVRVRVVVQKPNTVVNQFHNTYLQRLQNAGKTSSSSAAAAAASASASSSASSSSGSYYSSGTKTISAAPPPPAAPIRQKDYVKVASKVVDTQSLDAFAGTKSYQPPPPPRPISGVKTIVRKPVFEQQQLEKYEETHQPEPEPYSYDWKFGDDSGNGQFRREQGDKDGVVRGSYGYTDAWGLYRIVDYIADSNGFRASIRTNEPGLVERSPVTNQVESPAQIRITAEDTPLKVVELMRLTKPKPVTYQ